MTDYPPYALIDRSQPYDFGKCRWCQQEIIWGKTVKGKRAPFDPDTGVNHWITCPKRSDVRADLKEKDRGFP